MRIPRDIGGNELAKCLRELGYRITRQIGSHMRLTRSNGEEHHITIPRHKPLKIGTLSSILRDIADQLDMSKAELIDRLWGERKT
jgi:predicted RNA binding protein YcfA (HicA-like mRNA interferase family)